MMTFNTLDDFFTAHRTLCLAACISVSLCLIVQLWLTHHNDSMLRKLFWSLVLLVPLIGWVFYGGFYRPPQPDANAGHREYASGA
jgi:uncharacterized membrane protein